MVLADVCLYRVLGVERSFAVGAGDGLAVHVLGLDVPLEGVPVLDLLIANVAAPVTGFKLLHLQVSPH